MLNLNYSEVLIHILNVLLLASAIFLVAAAVFFTAFFTVRFIKRTSKPQKKQDVSL